MMVITRTGVTKEVLYCSSFARGSVAVSFDTC